MRNSNGTKNSQIMQYLGDQNVLKATTSLLYELSQNADGRFLYRCDTLDVRLTEDVCLRVSSYPVLEETAIRIYEEDGDRELITYQIKNNVDGACDISYNLNKYLTESQVLDILEDSDVNIPLIMKTHLFDMYKKHLESFDFAESLNDFSDQSKQL